MVSKGVPDYAEKELKRYEDQIKGLQDRYNTKEKNVDNNSYKKIVNAQLALAPTTGETLNHYLIRLQIYQKIASDREWTTHVDNPYKTWHCHKNPMGCFICDQTKFIACTIQVLQILSDKYPEFIF